MGVRAGIHGPYTEHVLFGVTRCKGGWTEGVCRGRHAAGSNGGKTGNTWHRGFDAHYLGDRVVDNSSELHEELGCGAEVESEGSRIRREGEQGASTGDDHKQCTADIAWEGHTVVPHLKTLTPHTHTHTHTST